MHLSFTLTELDGLSFHEHKYMRTYKQLDMYKDCTYISTLHFYLNDNFTDLWLHPVRSALEFEYVINLLDLYITFE